MRKEIEIPDWFFTHSPSVVEVLEWAAEILGYDAVSCQLGACGCPLADLAPCDDYLISHTARLADWRKPSTEDEIDQAEGEHFGAWTRGDL